MGSEKIDETKKVSFSSSTNTSVLEPVFEQTSNPPVLEKLEILII